MEKIKVKELIEAAHMAGQRNAGIDPSYNAALAYYNETIIDPIPEKVEVPKVEIKWNTYECKMAIHQFEVGKQYVESFRSKDGDTIGLIDDEPMMYIMPLNLVYTHFRKIEPTESAKGSEVNKYPLNQYHPCFPTGHSMYLVAEIDNGQSKYGEHKCSRCGYVEPFQYDYN